MAKEKEEIILGIEDLEQLDALAETSLPNREEIVNIHSQKLNRTISIRRGDVYKHASCMSSINQVAELLGLDKSTIKKHFSREINMAHAFARQKLLVRFYKLAVYGNNPADRIFALKNWANMSDQGLTEDLDSTDDGVTFAVKRPERPMQEVDSAQETLTELETLEDLPDSIDENN